MCCCERDLAVEQIQRELRDLVGLREDGHARLHQDVVLGQVGGFFGHIDVTDSRVRCAHVGVLGVDVVDRHLEAILLGAEGRAPGRELLDRAVDHAE